jgi:hypothetical protein
MTVIGFTAGGHCLHDHEQRLVSAGASVIARSAAELTALLCTDQGRVRAASDPYGLDETAAGQRSYVLKFSQSGFLLSYNEKSDC